MSSISWATLSGRARTERNTPAQIGTRLRCTSGRPKLAVVEATTRSHASTTSMPPPRAWPSTAAISGLSRRRWMIAVLPAPLGLAHPGLEVGAGREHGGRAGDHAGPQLGVVVEAVEGGADALRWSTGSMALRLASRSMRTTSTRSCTSVLTVSVICSLVHDGLLAPVRPSGSAGLPLLSSRPQVCRPGGHVEPLVVGVPREIKPEEHRVAITPDGVRELLHAGAEVLIEAGAGADSSIPDDDYRRAGATIVPTAAEVWERAGLVCKVKEPLAAEFAHFRPGLVLFTYLHLAAYPKVAEALVDGGVTAIAYETVQLADGSLPLLAPMSEVAGRMSVQVGAHFLERHNGGRGVLLGGAPGVRPARVAVLGAGNVGWNAAWMAAGLEAEVHLLDKNIDRLRHVDQIQMGRISTAGVQPGRGRAGRRRGRPRDRRRARARRPGAGGGERGDGALDEAGRGGHRHRHRPGRLRRDLPRDDPRRPGVRAPRGHPLRGRATCRARCPTPPPTR